MSKGGHMKSIVLSCMIFCSLHAMQEYQCRMQRSNSEPIIIICEKIPTPPAHASLAAQARRLSEERDKRRYKRKVKIALISLAGSIVGGLTALVVYLTK